MPSSLIKLVGNLGRLDPIETSKIVQPDKLDLVLRKEVFPYDCIDSVGKFNETSLPPRESFFSKLNDEEIDPDDYEHAFRVWEELQIKTLGDYGDFYVELDVTLLCDVIKEFRNLLGGNSYTYPGLVWQAMLKETKFVFELLTDIDMMLMVESGVSGGLTQSVTR